MILAKGHCDRAGKRLKMFLMSQPPILFTQEKLQLIYYFRIYFYSLCTSGIRRYGSYNSGNKKPLT
jgi:hypothetical protein